MSELLDGVAGLITAVSALIGTLTGAYLAVTTSRRMSERERKGASRAAVGKLAEVTADGELSADDLRQVLDVIAESTSKDPDHDRTR